MQHGDQGNMPCHQNMSSVQSDQLHALSCNRCICTAHADLLLPLSCRLPGLFENLFRPPSSGPGLQVYISAYNTIWLFVFVCVAYGVVSSSQTTLFTLCLPVPQARMGTAYCSDIQAYDSCVIASQLVVSFCMLVYH